MKIKAVCEATALTDRTIRYYIEEGLISPSYEENYLGRKTFDFSQSDIDCLKDISVLRRFGFSISEIREMIQHPEQIIPISQQLQLRKKNTIEEERLLVQALSRLNADFPYTVSSLAECLSEPIADHAMPVEEFRWDFFCTLRDTLRILRSFLLIWLPIIFSALFVAFDMRRFHYPVFSLMGIALASIFLLPSFSMLLLPHIRISAESKKKVQRILLILCAVSIFISPISGSRIVSHSETTDFRNYREFDAECLANRIPLFQDLFPAWVSYFKNVRHPADGYEAVYFEDAHYYYHYSILWEYKYDICVQVPLEKAAFDEEVVRAAAVMEEYAAAYERNGHWKYLVTQNGAYRCHIIYHGGEPFEPMNTDAYTYCIFAYDKENLRVRYIYCDSPEGCGDIPYYRELEW